MHWGNVFAAEMPSKTIKNEQEKWRRENVGQKDISEKILESFNDVFADIVNVLLFNGEEVLDENQLEEQAPRYAYKADGAYKEIERDVAKRWKEENIRIACVGIENQTTTDKDMPLRIIGYDGAEYRWQLSQKAALNRYPVVTVMLYFDHKKKWDKPLALFECLDIPEKFRPFVNDYKVNLFNIAFLTPEQVKLFKSDFRFVADYFVQMRMTGTYTGNREEISHVQETLSMMSIVTGDHRFEQAMQAEEGRPQGKEIKTMCEVLDRIEARGKAEGRAEGEEKGTLKTKIETAKNLKEMGMDISFIAQALKVTSDVVARWLGMQQV